MSRILLALSSATTLMVACNTTPAMPESPKILGTLEVNVGSDPSRNSARFFPTTRTLTPKPDSSVSVAPKSFVVFDDLGVTPTQRTLTAVYNITNNSGASLTNLSLVAYAKTGNTNASALKSINTFGGAPSNSDVNGVKPAQGTNGSDLVSEFHSDLQVYTPAESAALTSSALTANVINAGEYTLEYGFVVRVSAISHSRTISNGATGQVALSMRLPASADVSSGTRFVMTFIVAQNDNTHVVQSLEEPVNGSAALARATAIGGANVRVFPNSTLVSANRTNMVGARVTGGSSAPQSYLTSIPSGIPSVLGSVSLEWNTTKTATTNDSSNTFAFKPLSYSDIDDIGGGFRYLTMTFEVSNLSATNNFSNLTLRAINQQANASGMGVNSMFDFNSVAITNTSVLQSLLPIHGTKLTTSPQPDPVSSDFQAYSGLYDSNLEQNARTAGVLGTNDSVLDYGFVAKDINKTRALPASGKTYVTIGTKLPRTFPFASYPSCPNPAGCPKPYRFSLNFLVTQDPTLQFARGLGETTTAALTRATSLGTALQPAQLVLIGSDADVPSDPKIVLQRLPSVRIGIAPTVLPVP
jgi:hypothetical protein